jgi:hypothetical protein
MTQPTYEQRLRDEYAKWLQEIGHEADGKHTLEFCIAKHREFVKEVKEQFKDLIAHSSYKIDAGGRVEREHPEVERVCHEIIKDIDLMPILQLEETNEK